MIDVVTVGAGGGSIAWISPEGTLKVGPQSAGADPGPLCYAKGGTEPTITDAHVVLGRIPPHLLGGEIPSTSTPPARASRPWPTGSASTSSAAPPASSRSPPGTRPTPSPGERQARPRRARLHADDLRRLGLAPRLPPRRHPRPRRRRRAAEPRQRLGLRPAHRRRQERLRPDRGRPPRRPRPRRGPEDLRRADRPGRQGPRRRGLRPDAHRYSRTVDLRYFGQAYEVRVPARPGTIDEAYAADVADRFHDAHRALYGYDFRDDPRQQVEWVNLRVTGIGPITRPEPRTPLGVNRSRGRRGRALKSRRPVCFDATDGYVDTRVWWRPDLRAGDTISGRPSSRSSARPCPSTPASRCASTTSATSSSPSRRAPAMTTTEA